MDYSNYKWGNLLIGDSPIVIFSVMRIITGRFKGRRLWYPKDRSVRPTMDRVKESLFSSIGEDIVDKRVLSLFSGSGSLGLEAYSRGAKSVTFVDLQEISVQTIKKNLEMLEIEEEPLEVIHRDVMAAIDLLERRKSLFDYVFIDPPYGNNYIKKTLMKLEGSAILAPFSSLVLEHARDESVPESKSYNILKTKRFGRTYFTWCQLVE